jgi:predicted RNA-binding protein with PIN domain
MRGTADSPAIGVLRPVLELAWRVAKAGTQARPAVTPPARLRPLMRLAALPDRALVTIRQVLEEDANFRGRVVEWADETDLNRAARLWLMHLGGAEKEPESIAHAFDVREPQPEDSSGVGARADAELARLREVNAERAGSPAAGRQARQDSEPEAGFRDAASRRRMADRDAVEIARRRADEERARLQDAVRALEGRVSSLVTDLEDTASQLGEANQERDAARGEIASLQEQLRTARDEAARLQAGRDEVWAAAGRRAEADRDAVEVARQVADEERARLEDAVGALEGRVSSLVADLEDTAGQLAEASRQRDSARAETELLSEQLETAVAEAERGAAEFARHGADDERARLGVAVEALEGRVLALVTDLEETAGQVTQASAELDRSRAETALLKEQLELALADAVRLQADHDAVEMARQVADEERSSLQEAVGALEGRVASLVGELESAAGQATQSSQQRDSAHDDMAVLADELDQARADAARWRAERDTSEGARRSADEERARLEEAVGELEDRVSSLVSDLDDTAAQVVEACEQRDSAQDDAARVSVQLQRVQAELDRLAAHRDESRAAAGRGIARAAEAARLLSQTLAEVALTGGQAKVEGALTGAGQWLPPEPRAAAGNLALTQTSRIPEWFADDGPPTSAGPVQQDWEAPFPGDEERALEEPPRAEVRIPNTRTGPNERSVSAHRQPADQSFAAAKLAGTRLRRGESADSEALLAHRRSAPGQPQPGSAVEQGADERQPTAPEIAARAALQSPPSGPRRRPIPLPRSMFYDSVEAADHLTAVPGIRLIVDGDNATSTSSSAAELSGRRQELADSLAELAKRVGTQVHLVFQDADVSERFGPPAAARRQMRVTFSAEGATVDVVIRELIDQLDRTEAVLVATNDSQLEQWVRRNGGNVISRAQLVAVLDSQPRSDALAKSRRRSG